MAVSQKASMKKMTMAAAAVVMVFFSVGDAEEEVHHVVGGDRGWDPSTDVASWSSGRIFRVGDKIWFTYSAAQGKVLELNTKEEYDSCDVSSPIKMYADGLDSILLDGEGIRYFVSSDTENCKNGLKLHVDVMPQGTPDDVVAKKVNKSEKGSVSAVAAGPTPSGSTHLGPCLVLLLAGFWIFHVSF